MAGGYIITDMYNHLTLAVQGRDEALSHDTVVGLQPLL